MELSKFPPDDLVKRIRETFLGRAGCASFFPDMSVTAVVFCTLWCIESVLRDLVYYELRGVSGEKWIQDLGGIVRDPPLKQRAAEFLDSCLDAALRPDPMQLLTLRELGQIVTLEKFWTSSFKSIFRKKDDFQKKDIALLGRHPYMREENHE